MFGNRQDFADRLQNAGASVSQNANSVLAVMVGASVELAQGEGYLPDSAIAPKLKPRTQSPSTNPYAQHPPRSNPRRPGYLGC